MKYTNNDGLPEIFARAVQNETYDKGESDFSITGLLKPSRQYALQIKHHNEITEDVSDRVWSLFGQLGHLLIERAGTKNEINEKRYFGKFNIDAIGRAIVVSGQVDSISLTNQTLTDWKFTSSYGFKWGKVDKPDWIAQLNMQLELLRMNGLNAKELQIGAILRDWSKGAAQRDPEYPQKPVLLVPIEMWPRERTQAFIKERIFSHLTTLTGIMPECTKEERWAKDTKWALMVKGKTKANKLFSERAAAELAIDYVKDSYIEERPGESTRCKSYCSASKYCEQYKQTIKGEDDV